MEHPETRRHGVLEHVAHDVDAVVQGVKPHLRGWLHAGTFPVAVAVGRVAGAGEDDVYGNFVLLDHGDELQTMYGHAAEVFVRSGVDAPTRITRGRALGQDQPAVADRCLRQHFFAGHGKADQAAQVALQPVRQRVDALKQGGQLVMFPEGRRLKAGETRLEPKSGVGFLAAATGAGQRAG